MKIINSTSLPVSWFCFNHLDSLKVIALASGDIAGKVTNDENQVYTPPSNLDGFYGVRFTRPGGIPELAMGTVSGTGTITLLEGVGGTYYVEVKPEPH